MSKANTIPEFLGILAGIIVVGSIVGVIITMAFEEANKAVKNKLQTNPNLIPSQKTSQKAFTEILQHSKNSEEYKIPEIPKMKVATFVTDAYLIQQDPIRYMTGSPGEVTRVLSENYYRLFFNGTKTSENALEFLEYRANSFNAITGAELNKESLKAISNKYNNNVSTQIFFLCYHENFSGEFDVFSNDLVSAVYKIILEEHNKVCPEGQEEISEFSVELFLNVKEIYSKYNHIADLSNGITTIDSHIDNDYDDDDDEDDFYDYFEENDIKYTEVVYSDEVINKKSNVFWVGKLENIIILEIEKFIPNNEQKGNPLEGLMIMERMQKSRDNYKNQLILNKIKFGVTDEDIEYIMSKVYKTVHNKFIES